MDFLPLDQLLLSLRQFSINNFIMLFTNVLTLDVSSCCFIQRLYLLYLFVLFVYTLMVLCVKLHLLRAEDG